MIKFNRPELFERPPEAIFFDMDNTFYANAPAHEMAMSVVRDKVTRLFSISAEQFDQAFLKARAEVKQRLKDTAASHSRLLYMQRMLEIIGLGSQLLLALDFEQTYWRTFLSHAQLFDNVKGFLNDLRLLGIPTIIVTDLTAQIQFRKIVYFDLEPFFDLIVTSEEAGLDKPNPAIFLLAREKLKLTENRIWMIGDNAINDIRGARDLIGAITLQKLHEGVTEGTGDNQPDAAFHLFDDVCKLLARIA